MYYKLRHRHNYIYFTGLGLVMFMLFLLQAGTAFPRLFSVYPLPLIPLTVCVAVFNSEVTAFVFGLGAGMLMDIVSPTTDGFNTLVMLAIGLAIGLLTELLFNERLLTTLILSGGICVLYYLIYWLAVIVPMGDPGTWLYLVKFSLPAIIYTWIFTVPFYYLSRWLYRISVDQPKERGGVK